MIPKKIHYCWFGRNDLPRKARKCIASWRRYCPDYEIIEWNEDNFDIYLNGYTKMCYEQKKFAFLSDYVRLYVVAKHGGIYFDTDVEIVKSFDDLLSYQGFAGFENDNYVASGLGFGAEAGNKAVLQMLDEYEQLLDGKNGTIGCPHLNTKALQKLGLQLNGKLQEIEGMLICSSDYFNPYDDLTGRLNKTINTYSIHWYSKSWMSKTAVIRSMITKPLHRVFGADCFHKFKK